LPELKRGNDPITSSSRMSVECRPFFDDFAREKGLNALNPDSWFDINLKQLLGRTGGSAISRRYHGMKNALMAAYPEVHFSKWA